MASGEFYSQHVLPHSLFQLTSQQTVLMLNETLLRAGRRTFLLCTGLLILTASALGVNEAWAQNPEQTPRAARPPVVPETPEFKAASDALREHLKQMREVMVHYNTELPNLPQDREMREQWFELLSQGVPIFQRMIAAAVAEYQRSPNPTGPLGTMLWDTFDRRTKVDLYEGMLPVGQALLASGYEKPELPSAIVRTAYAMNEFDAVRQLAPQLTGDADTSPQVEDILEEVEEFEALWAAELAAREQDAQGPPLPRVLMKTTKGDIELELFENQAPETVANFISLVESGFYEGLIFHRVLEHFMAQTGCPIGDGSGSPGYRIYGEADKPDARKFFRGTLGMALAGEPNSGGSQFFITFLPNTYLNGTYTAFGRVTKGIEVLGHLVRVDPESDEEEKKKPSQPLDEIISIEVLSKRGHDYVPHKVK